MAKQDATALFVEDHVNASGLDAELKTQVLSAIEGCMQCHSFRPDEHQNAPGLGAIAGERFGSTKFAGYSAAMRAASGYWDEENLIAFIEQPSQVVPGTVMPDPNIADPRVRGEIAKLLEALKNSGE